MDYLSEIKTIDKTWIFVTRVFVWIWLILTVAGIFVQTLFWISFAPMIVFFVLLYMKCTCPFCSGKFISKDLVFSRKNMNSCPECGYKVYYTQTLPNHVTYDDILPEEIPNVLDDNDEDEDDE